MAAYKRKKKRATAMLQKTGVLCHETENCVISRRESEKRFHTLDTRLHVVETKIENVASVLVGQRESTDALVRAAQKNGQDIAILHGMVANIENSVVRAIAEHAEAEATQRMKQTRTAFWTLLTVVTTLGITLSLHMLDKVFFVQP